MAGIPSVLVSAEPWRAAENRSATAWWWRDDPETAEEPSSNGSSSACHRHARRPMEEARTSPRGLVRERGATSTDPPRHTIGGVEGREPRIRPRMTMEGGDVDLDASGAIDTDGGRRRRWRSKADEDGGGGGGVGVGEDSVEIGRAHD